MTELIDSFQSKYPKGRGKALTLLILTSVGSLAKAIVSLILFYIVSVERASRYMGKDDKFIYVTFLVIGACGILNFAGSFLMFRRKQAGIWIYIVGQLIGALIFTWCILAVNSKIGEEEQVGLLIAYVVTIIYMVLYLSNWKYYSPRPGNPDGTGL